MGKENPGNPQEETPHQGNDRDWIRFIIAVIAAAIFVVLVVIFF
jgi:hypothetical protein